MKKILFSFLFTLSLVANELITICGTGDSEELLKDLAKAYENKYQNTTICIPKSIGSGGGIENVALDRCELGRVARKLKKDEISFNLNYLLFAYSPVVFVANSNIKGISNLTTKDIIGIYNGDIKNWNYFNKNIDGKIYVARREPGDSSIGILNKNIQGYKDIKNFAGKVLYSTPKTVKIIKKYKNTIGYLPIAQTIETKLNIFNFNGVKPNKTNIQNGSYPLVSPFGLVYKGKLNQLSKSFIDFLSTSEAMRIYKKYGVVSVLNIQD